MFNFVSRSRQLAGACLGLCLLLPLEPVAAQPTQAQQSAIRSNCRSDYMSHCSSVKPGGIEALQCLQRNAAKLSSGCQSAVNAISPPSPPPQQAMPAPASTHAPAAPHQPAAPEPTTATPAAPAAAPAARTHAPAHTPPTHTPPAHTTAAPANAHGAVAQACRSDFMSHCKGVQPGGPAAQQCLQRNAAKLSAPCARALVGASGSGAPTAARAPTAAPPAQTGPAAAPTAQQQQAIRNTCQRDFQANCRGVSPGGAEALACLQRNSARLSPNCRTSVAAIGMDVPETAAAQPAAAPAPAGRPVGPLRRAIRERMMER